MPFKYETVHKTVQELIGETVKICLEAYKKRVEARDTIKVLEKDLFILEQIVEG